MFGIGCSQNYKNLSLGPFDLKRVNDGSREACFSSFTLLALFFPQLPARRLNISSVVPLHGGHPSSAYFSVFVMQLRQQGERTPGQGLGGVPKETEGGGRNATEESAGRRRRKRWEGEEKEEEEERKGCV